MNGYDNCSIDLDHETLEYEHSEQEMRYVNWPAIVLLAGALWAFIITLGG